MKKLITKFTLLVGAFLLLGAGNGKAATYTVYYDASGYINYLETNTSTRLYEFGDMVDCTFYGNTNTKIQEYVQGENIGDNIFKFSIESTTTPVTVQFRGYRKLKSTGAESASNTDILLNSGQSKGNVWASGPSYGSINSGQQRATFYNNAMYTYKTTFGTSYGTATANAGAGVVVGYSTNIGTDLSWSNEAGIDIENNSCTVQVSEATTMNPCVFLLNSSVTMSSKSIKYNTAYSYSTSLYLTYKVTYQATQDGTAQDVTGNSEYYTITSTPNANNNNISGIGMTTAPAFKLLKTGIYTLSAEMPSNYTWVGEAPTLTVNVVPLAVIVGKITDLAWNPNLAQGTWSTNYGTNPFEGLIYYTRTESNEDYEFELNVNIEPTFTTVEQPTQWSESTGMDSWIWNQMVAVKNTNYIDGYYYTNDDLTPAISEFTNTNSSMSADVENYFFPCSGTYKMTVTATGTDADKVFVNNGEQVINVYPSADLIYSYTLNGNPYNEGLNVSGYTVVAGKMVIADDLTSYDDLILYIPGVYLVSVDYAWNADSDVAVAASTTTTSGGNIDLTGVNATQKELVLSLTKNGATTPASEVTKILVSTGSNDTTGVEGFGAETEGEVIYYNLQGVKVANPEKGIFVKVEGGKATKIII